MLQRNILQFLLHVIDGFFNASSFCNQSLKEMEITERRVQVIKVIAYKSGSGYGLEQTLYYIRKIFNTCICRDIIVAGYIGIMY